MHSANKQREPFKKRVRQSTPYSLHVKSMFSTNYNNINNFKHQKQSSNIHRNHLGTELFLFILCTSFNAKLGYGYHQRETLVPVCSPKLSPVLEGG